MGGGGVKSFTTKAQYFYSGQYGSNDLPRPRRSALRVLLVYLFIFKDTNFEKVSIHNQ